MKKHTNFFSELIVKLVSNCKTSLPYEISFKLQKELGEKKKKKI